MSLPNTQIPKFYFYGHVNRRVLEKASCKEKFFVAGPILLTLSNTYKVRDAFLNAS